MRAIPFLLTVSILLGALAPAVAEPPDERSPRAHERKRRYVLYSGVAAVNLDSSLKQTDKETGFSFFVDPEGQFDLPEDEVVPSFGLLVSFALRRYISVTFTRFLRSAAASLEEDIDLGDAILKAGGSYVVTLNSNDFDVAYATVLRQDDRLRILGKLGLYVLDLDLGVQAKGSIEVGQKSDSGTFDATTSLVAPLPLFGVQFDFDIVERWALLTSVEAIYLPIGDITGQAFRTQIRTRYRFNDTVGIGFGFSDFDIEVTEESDTRKNEIKYRYGGFYAGMVFTF